MRSIKQSKENRTLKKEFPIFAKVIIKDTNKIVIADCKIVPRDTLVINVRTTQVVRIGKPNLNSKICFL